MGYDLAAPVGECSITGEIEAALSGKGPDSTKNVFLTCKKVTAAGFAKCTVNSIGAPAGTFTTNELSSTLVWLKETGAVAGSVISPTAYPKWTEFEVTGSECPVSSKGVVKNRVIGEILPVEGEAQTGELVLRQNNVLLSYWNNENPRASVGVERKKIENLETKEVTNQTLSGNFAISLNSKEPFGVAASTRLPAGRLEATTSGTGVTKSFAATTPELLTITTPWGIAIKMPECTTARRSR